MYLRSEVFIFYWNCANQLRIKIAYPRQTNPCGFPNLAPSPLPPPPPLRLLACGPMFQTSDIWARGFYPESGGMYLFYSRLKNKLHSKCPNTSLIYNMYKYSHYFQNSDLFFLTVYRDKKKSVFHYSFEQLLSANNYSQSKRKEQVIFISVIEASKQLVT